MKLALVVPGGVDRSGTHRVVPCVLWLMERLARVHELHVFAIHHEPRSSRYPLLGATVHNIGPRPRRLRAVRAILAEHRRGPFDVLHAIWGLPSGVVAAVAAGRLRRPVIVHLAGGELAAVPDIRYGDRRSRRARFWLRFALARAARVTVPSDAMLDRARALGIAAERVPLGVALDRWPPRPPRRRRPDERARLLFVGSLNRVKDPGTLIRAAAALRDAGAAFRLDVVGEDLSGGEVARLARGLGLDDQVRFHGFLPQTELRPRVQAADLLLVSSRHEAGPVVALEAAVVGVPTVGTAVGLIADWAPDAAAAVPPADAAALARAALEVLADEDRRQAIATAAQRLAIAEDADYTAARVASLYEDVRTERSPAIEAGAVAADRAPDHGRRRGTAASDSRGRPARAGREASTMSPLVSVVVPTHDRLPYLREAVDSVSGQDYADWELIVVDDGSTDGTAEWIHGLGDPRIRLLALSRSGNLGRLRNEGIRAARGSLIAFLDSDDLFEPGKLGAQVAALVARPECGWSYTAMTKIDGQGRELDGPGFAWPRVSGRILKELLRFDAVVDTPTVMARRELLYRVGLLDESLPGCQDYDLLFRLAEASPCVMVPEPLTRKRIHPAVASGDRTRINEAWVVVYERCRRRSVDPAVRRLCARQARAHRIHAASCRLRGREPRLAFAHVLAVLRSRPWAPRAWWVLLRGVAPVMLGRQPRAAAARRAQAGTPAGP